MTPAFLLLSLALFHLGALLTLFVIARRTEAAPTAAAGSEYSDERYKRAMTPLEDVPAKLGSIRAFAYTDEAGNRRIGVSAQSVQVYFPEAVLTDAGGRLSVAYGSLALACLVDYSKINEREYQAVTADIRSMRRRLDALDNRVPPHAPLQVDKAGLK